MIHLNYIPRPFDFYYSGWIKIDLTSTSFFAGSLRLLLNPLHLLLFLLLQPLQLLLGNLSEADVEVDVLEVVLVEGLQVVLLAEVYLLCLFAFIHDYKQ